VRILVTADPYLPVPPKYYGGIERIVASLIAGLRQLGHTVGLVAHPESGAQVEFLAKWPQLDPRSGTAHVSNTLALRNAVGDFQPSLVHSFSRLLYLVPLLPFGLPKIMSYQRQTGGRQTRIAALIGGRSLAFTGNSEFIATMGRRHGGRWLAIPNFVDTNFYRLAPTVARDAPLVFLSRIETIKGTHVAIETAKKTGKRLLIAGNYAESGPERDYWDQVIKPELGRNGVEYIGAVDDAGKLDLLQSAAAMIVPIQWDEPFGIVFAEALACGTPVISCPRGALPEIVRHGLEGFHIRNVEEACRAVDAIATIDRHQCRRRAELEFSADVVVGQYDSLYRQMLAQD
jgi:glycosyltransferase involved in cell wall biosynthesis